MVADFMARVKPCAAVCVTGQGGVFGVAAEGYGAALANKLGIGVVHDCVLDIPVPAVGYLQWV